MTSLPSIVAAKKSMKMTFSSDKIYYNFSHEFFSFSGGGFVIQRLQIFKIPIDVIRTLNYTLTQLGSFTLLDKFVCRTG